MRTFVVLTITVVLITAGGPIAAQDVPPQPVQVVASILELSEPQLATWLEILAARDAGVQPLVQQLRSRQQLLAEALQHPSPDAQTVGQLLIESRAIEQSIDSVRRQANISFEQMLTDEQRQRLQHIRSASQVCPIVPALQATGLL